MHDIGVYPYKIIGLDDKSVLRIVCKMGRGEDD